MIKPTILYICSAAHAGSTLVDTFLGGHSRIASLGETNFLSKDIAVGMSCSCGSKLSECESWGQVFSLLKASQGVDILANPYAFRLWDALAFRQIDHAHQTKFFTLATQLRKACLELKCSLPKPLGARLPIPPQLRVAVQNKMTLYTCAAQALESDILVDASKNFREAIELHRACPDQIRILLLIRDGRGVYLSNRKRNVSKESSLYGWKSYYKRAIRHFKKHLPPEHVFTIKYEDFTNDPAGSGDDICRFLGLNFESGMLDISNAMRHQINGNHGRRGQSIVPDERWRTDLSPEEMEYFNCRGGAALNRHLGYI